MKNIVILFVLGILVVVAGFSYNNLTEKNAIKKEPVQLNLNTPITPTGPVECSVISKYIVVTKPSPETVGDLILIKKSGLKNNLCEYLVEDGDFEIIGENVITIDDHYLVTDAGSAPFPRALQVYDLKLNKKIFTDSYSKPVEVKDGKITYWQTMKEQPTKATCPKLDEYTNLQLGAVLKLHVSLSLSDLKISDLSEDKICSETQG